MASRRLLVDRDRPAQSGPAYVELQRFAESARRAPSFQKPALGRRIPRSVRRWRAGGRLHNANSRPSPRHDRQRLRARAYRAKRRGAKQWLDAITGVLPAREKYSDRRPVQSEAGQPNEVATSGAYPDLNARAEARGNAMKDPAGIFDQGPGLSEEMHPPSCVARAALAVKVKAAGATRSVMPALCRASIPVPGGIGCRVARPDGRKSNLNNSSRACRGDPAHLAHRHRGAQRFDRRRHRSGKQASASSAGLRPAACGSHAAQHRVEEVQIAERRTSRVFQVIASEIEWSAVRN